MDGTGSGSCAVAGFGISGVEPSTDSLLALCSFQPNSLSAVPLKTQIFSDIYAVMLCQEFSTFRSTILPSFFMILKTRPHTVTSQAYFNILHKSILALHAPVTCHGDLYLRHFAFVIPYMLEACSLLPQQCCWYSHTSIVLAESE